MSCCSHCTVLLVCWIKWVKFAIIFSLSGICTSVAYVGYMKSHSNIRTVVLSAWLQIAKMCRWKQWAHLNLPGQFLVKFQVNNRKLQRWMVSIEGHVVCEGIQPTLPHYFPPSIFKQEDASCALEFTQTSGIFTITCFFHLFNSMLF